MSDIDIELEGLAELKQDFEKVKDDWGEKEVWAVGTNLKYGFYLEFGTEDMPPYEWFRPAIREFKANPERFIVENTDLNSFEKINSTGELVRSTAAALQSKMEDNVNAQDETRDRSPGTDDDHPARDIGTLTNSIKAVRIR